MNSESFLNVNEIYKRLKPSASCVRIDFRESVTSTNTVAKELAENGAHEGTTVIAEQQSAGKGRLGRNFHSPKGSGLYISVILRPKFSAEESLSITTAAAVAVSAAIDSVTGKSSKIKWVNDVYLNGYKVCGILTEAAIDLKNSSLRYAVLGIGVNVKEPDGGFSEDIKNIAGALYRDKLPYGTANALAAEILNRFFGFYNKLSDHTFMLEYKERSLLTGMKIHFNQGEECYSGNVLDIDDDAKLLVKLENGTVTAFSAGEISVDKNFLSQVRNAEELTNYET